MELTFLQNRLIVALLSIVVGAILTLLIRRILNKRGLFTYFVSHYRVGVSADDAVFGTVQAICNNLPVANLWSSSVELRNESLKDYENVIVKVFTNDTVLLSERTEIVDTSHILEWTEGFAARVAVLSGSRPWHPFRTASSLWMPAVGGWRRMIGPSTWHSRTRRN